MIMDVEKIMNEPIYVIIVEDEKTKIKDEIQDRQSPPFKEETDYFETLLNKEKAIKEEENEDEYIVNVKRELNEIDENYEVDPMDFFDYSSEIHSPYNTCKEEEEEYLFKKEDLSDEEYHPESDYEEEYLSDDNQHTDEDELLDAKSRNRKRRLETKHSLINDICNENPDLRNNKDALVQALLQIMRTQKPPKLPIDFYNVSSGSEYVCSKCEKVFSSLSACGRHYQDYHGAKYLSCLACGITYRNKWTLYRHEKICTAPYAKLVLKARGYFLGRKGRNRPFLQRQLPFLPNANDAARNLSCNMCSAKFQSKTSLESHERSHRGERPYQCELCAHAYTSFSALMRHKKTHEEPKYVCQVCGRKFRQKDTLITHTYTHGEPRFACNECPRKYRTNHALKLHVHSVHLKLPPPCACRLCPKRFRRMSVLNNHMKREHGVAILTRKMYFKRLPLLSKMEVEKAKVILANDEDYTLDEAASK